MRILVPSKKPEQCCQCTYSKLPKVIAYVCRGTILYHLASILSEGSSEAAKVLYCTHENKLSQWIMMVKLSIAHESAHVVDSSCSDVHKA